MGLRKPRDRIIVDAIQKDVLVNADVSRKSRVRLGESHAMRCPYPFKIESQRCHIHVGESFCGHKWQSTLSPCLRMERRPGL